MAAKSAALALVFASLVHCQGYPGGYGGGNPYSDGGSDSSNGNPYSNSNNGNNGPFGFQGPEQFLSHYHTMVIAHAVLATVAFALLFPIGGILIRLASFPGLWWVHGLFQMFAYLLYIAAFAIGIYMATNLRLMDMYHPVIGIVLFLLLLFQPVLSLLHHTLFKKYSRRAIWSYGHIWLGRGIITLGIVNGGLGLQLARTTGLFAPSQSAIIAYGVVAGVIWLVYILSAIYGESKRSGGRDKGDVTPTREYKGRGRHGRV